MTPIAEMVRKLFEKGVDQEAILIAIEAAEQVMSTRHPPDIQVDETIEKRRAWDREYRRRRRMSGGCPPDSTRHPPDTENASLSNQEKKEERKEEEAPKRRVHPTRGHRLPDDWQPTPQDLAVAEELIGASRTASELEKFRDHWKQQPGSKGVKLDWDAAWRNWFRRAADYLPGGVNGRRKTVHDAARELHEGFLAQNPFDEPTPRGLRNGTGEDVVRLLPARRCE